MSGNIFSVNLHSLVLTEDAKNLISVEEKPSHPSTHTPNPVSHHILHLNPTSLRWFYPNPKSLIRPIPVSPTFCHPIPKSTPHKHPKSRFPQRYSMACNISWENQTIIEKVLEYNHNNFFERFQKCWWWLFWKPGFTWNGSSNQTRHRPQLYACSLRAIDYPLDVPVTWGWQMEDRGESRGKPRRKSHTNSQPGSPER